METKHEPKRRRNFKINRFSQARLIEAMIDGIYTCAELAELTGLHYVTVLDYTRELHRAKAAYISHWEKDSRNRDMIKVYKLGRGKDAKREKLTQAERAARYRMKRKSMMMIQTMAGTTCNQEQT